ncbi:hypothetical protein B0A91_06965 [Pseudomonas syringae]|uniref:hypothetical protein n=1 Tax=Pseudomonas syringae TaxID=317 RepID=UPI000464219B|nr:hypothetical protein [Pseudomonas syringae]MBI6561840.1 hypothetical protein [Pseudomonas syringae]MBI6573212.1 hypothetical protein [Pseudomonas syringae]MBI6589288.1 hypothetical protein [Pseudomonas syringae]MBI6596035.1 hypothetical protein [Pseudomonas syringae]MDC6528291.1 hypothetical protein [Pseudomonas syringae]
MTKGIEAAESRMSIITNTRDPRDLGDALTDVDAYIDALRDFDHLTEAEHSRLQKDARRVLAETDEKLKKASRIR